MSKGEQLTTEMVLSKTKADNLQSIKNLNLWGNDLEDLQLLKQMPNLEVISLSVNKINSLKEFANCHKLQELYLRKNLIQDIQEIKHLAKLQDLKVLWLQDNPCSQIDNYRLVVIKILPNLHKLDNNIVTPEERELSNHVKLPNMAVAESIQKKQSKQADPTNAGLVTALTTLLKELDRPALMNIGDQIMRLMEQKR